MKRALVLAAVVAALATPAARADGDPASDVLYSSWVFLPFTTKIPSGYQTALTQTVLAARKAGYPIKVALIEQRYDLGAIPELYRKPQAYARFLGLELAFIYHGPLLIVQRGHLVRMAVDLTCVTTPPLRVSRGPLYRAGRGTPVRGTRQVHRALALETGDLLEV